MSIAENLLNSLPETAYENSRIAGSGDEEEHIVVNDNREVIVPENLKIIAVQDDKDVETVTIDCIRYWDNHDLSTFDIYIKCELPNRDEVTYAPEEISVKANYFSFDWVIGREITPISGKLKFWIVAKIVDEDGKDIYQWSSLQNEECSVASGGGQIYVPETAEEKDTESKNINQVRIIEEETTEGSDNTPDFEEAHIVVNGNRRITVPDNLKIIAVKGDKNIETVTIDCVRFWDGHDLSTFAVYINYKLPNGKEGTYIPKTITVKEDVFSFDWVIERYITSYVGLLTFWIVTKDTDDSANLLHQWSSFQNQDCSIEQGGDKIYVPEEQTDKDIISQAISVSRQASEDAQEAAKRAEEAADRAESGGGGVSPDLENRLSALEQWKADQEYVAISITSFSATESIYEMGQTVTSVTLNWRTNKTPYALTFDGVSIDVNAKSKTVTGEFKMDSAKKSWTLVAKGERGETNSKTAGISFLNGVYYGALEEPAEYNSNFILNLTKELRSNKKPSFSVTAGTGQYIYYCLPVRMGECIFTVGVLPGGFNLVKTINFTNASRYSEDYYIYRSNNANLGTKTVNVS